MRRELLTVKEAAALSGVTVKTLHHYHKIGLLVPSGISEAGYRLYGRRELERLQQIRFYRELDFPLDRIKELLAAEPERLAILSEQRELLLARKTRLERLIRTIEESADGAKKGEEIEVDRLFKGFGSEAEWKEALSEQNEHLKANYGYDLNEQGPIDPEAMNEQAAEAARFMGEMAEALRSGKRHDAEEVRSLIGRHLEFQAAHGHAADASAFAATCRFFLGDDFHRAMLESQQTGLAYYLTLAAEAHAEASSGR
ncbi:MerR family transcriptional regulator [Cohnella xylanilytica]|uniref:MerR family transcriptional regulator n=1 Tax=Cohnella xylanilytica TaxID=557555 RepID=A0A841UBM2_9BACL|nr:MerR family transcriptional regulator [Cohnella xylanilytica]MBB6695351.1 MerR family transcriptional regulator [Cohnella xylanilytica]GIO15504.1 MerR family transcriptional regulator [Cohnella xylanilytica]